MPKFSDFLDTLTTDQLGHLKQDIAKTDPVSVFKANLQKRLDDLHTQAQPQEVSLRKEFYQAQQDNDIEALHNLASTFREKDLATGKIFETNLKLLADRFGVKVFPVEGKPNIDNVVTGFQKLVSQNHGDVPISLEDIEANVKQPYAAPRINVINISTAKWYTFEELSEYLQVSCYYNLEFLTDLLRKKFLILQVDPAFSTGTLPDDFLPLIKANKVWAIITQDQARERDTIYFPSTSFASTQEAMIQGIQKIESYTQVHNPLDDVPIKRR